MRPYECQESNRVSYAREPRFRPELRSGQRVGAEPSSALWFVWLSSTPTKPLAIDHFT
jgi:hypothetical protein